MVRVTYIVFGTRSASIVGIAQYGSGLVLDKASTSNVKTDYNLTIYYYSNMLNCEHCLTVLEKGNLQIELQKLQNRPRASSRPRAQAQGHTLHDKFPS